MNALSGQGIEIDRHGRSEGLPLTGFHLSDLPLMENDTSHNLYIEVSHAKGSYRGLPDEGKGLREYGIQRFTTIESSPELGCL